MAKNATKAAQDVGLLKDMAQGRHFMEGFQTAFPRHMEVRAWDVLAVICNFNPKQRVEYRRVNHAYLSITEVYVRGSVPERLCARITRESGCSAVILIKLEIAVYGKKFFSECDPALLPMRAMKLKTVTEEDDFLVPLRMP